MLKNEITYLILFFCLEFGFLLKVNAQQIYVEIGAANAIFKDYQNSKGENTLEAYSSKPLRPFLACGYRLNILNNKVHLNIGLNESSYRIETAFLLNNTTIPTTYKLSYLGLLVGTNISIIKWKDIMFQLHAHLSNDWLTSAVNEYENHKIDLYRQLDKRILRYHAGLAMQYNVSNDIDIFLKYTIANSFKLQSQDFQNGEHYSLLTKSLSIGLLYTIRRW